MPLISTRALPTWIPLIPNRDTQLRGFDLCSRFVDRASMGGALLESTLSASSFRASVWPQGSLAMVLTSEGNQGNYFSQQMRTVSRVECRETYSLSRNWMGVHNLKFDMTLGGTAEHGLIQGHPINTVDSTGAPLE